MLKMRPGLVMLPKYGHGISKSAYVILSVTLYYLLRLNLLPITILRSFFT